MYERSFRGRINQLYDESGLPVNKFAERCKVSRQSMQYYLDGERNPDSVRIKKICDGCKVSADWLLAISDVRTLSVDARMAIEYTGLPEGMIERIKVSYNKDHVDALAELIEDEMFPHLLEDYKFFLMLLNNIGSIDEFDNVNDTEVTQDKRINMSYSTALSLLASQVGDDMSEICRHKQQELFISLIDSIEDDGQGCKDF